MMLRYVLIKLIVIVACADIQAQTQGKIASVGDNAPVLAAFREIRDGASIISHTFANIKNVMNKHNQQIYTLTNDLQTQQMEIHQLLNKNNNKNFPMDRLTNMEKRLNKTLEKLQKSLETQQQTHSEDQKTLLTRMETMSRQTFYQETKLEKLTKATNGQKLHMDEMIIEMKNLKDSMKKLNCKDNWIKYKNQCYKLGKCDSTVVCSPQNLRSICKNSGGDFASIFSKQDNKFIHSLNAGADYIMIGGSYDTTSGKWVWPNGEQMKYENWWEKPKFVGVGMCVFMMPQLGEWNVVSCTDKQPTDKVNIAYVCQRDYIPQ